MSTILLKVGSKGEMVKKLQKALGVVPDGVFGLNTEKKLKEYQKNKGLTADGIAGEKTLKALGLIENISTVDTKNENLHLDKLKGYIPTSVLSEIESLPSSFGLTSNLRLAHFLSQCAVESVNFKVKNENLNYSAERLVKVFPNYFPTYEIAKKYANNPQKIANKVYGNRMGNGNESTGDGYKYRGRGYIQLTGKTNYSKFNNSVTDDILSNPDLVSSKYPLTSAVWYFWKYGLWTTCDKGSTDGIVKSVTKLVNGGTNGYAERLQYFKRYWNILK